MRYVSLLLVHINVTVQNQLRRLFVQRPPCQNTIFFFFTAFIPPSLLQGIQEKQNKTKQKHFETLNTQYPSDQLIFRKRGA